MTSGDDWSDRARGEPIHRAVRPVLVAGLGLALATTTPGTAGAAKRSHTDARGDVRVVTVTAEAESDELPPSRASRSEVGDVLRTAVAYRQHHVSVRIRYADLTRRISAAHLVRVVGSNGVRRLVTVVDEPGEASFVMMEALDGSQTCAGRVRHRVDHDAATVSMAFPSRCLGSPRRIRVGGTFYRFGGSADTSTIVYDHLARAGGELDGGRGFGPAVRRG